MIWAVSNVLTLIKVLLLQTQAIVVNCLACFANVFIRGLGFRYCVNIVGEQPCFNLYSNVAVVQRVTPELASHLAR